KWHGYEYWLACSNYWHAVQDSENPMLFVGNSPDSMHWLVIGADTLQNPIRRVTDYARLNGVKPTYMSDPKLFLTKDNRLAMINRITYNLAFGDSLYRNGQRLVVMTSADGFHWSDTLSNGQTAFVVNDTGDRACLSPCVVIDTGGRYLLFTASAGRDCQGRGRFDLRRYVSMKHDSGYTYLGQCSYPKSNWVIWHFDIIPYGRGDLLMVAMEQDSLSAGVAGGRTVLSVSHDLGASWDRLPDPLAGPSGLMGETQWEIRFYKMAPYWTDREGHPALGLFYSALGRPRSGDNVDQMHIGHTIIPLDRSYELLPLAEDSISESSAELVTLRIPQIGVENGPVSTSAERVEPTPLDTFQVNGSVPYPFQACSLKVWYSDRKRTGNQASEDSAAIVIKDVEMMANRFAWLSPPMSLATCSWCRRFDHPGETVKVRFAATFRPDRAHVRVRRVYMWGYKL
ncbi:MAG TPA: hypothetical protein VMS71_05800, partial [Candidatus Acidoferrum sp.]|nr:hypothetical protein [Candidatus Acidoferrum sp.]